MKSLNRHFLRLLLLAALFVASATIVPPATAAPILSVAPIWRPGTQLTTLIGASGDPYPRYVDAEVYLTTNTHFWSVQLTCTVSPTVLTSYTFDGPSSTPDPGDDVPLVRWGPAWGNNSFDFAEIPATLSNTEVVIATASRLGQSQQPMGVSGFTQTILLATIHYQVKTTAGTSPFTCTSIFLDRDGVSVGTATYSAPTPLTVIAGYTLSGSLTYQGRAAKSGIGVQCVGTSNTVSMVTDASGKYSANTRALGHYQCTYFGNITSPSSTPHNDLYMQSPTELDLNTQSYTFLPFSLFGGNVDLAGPSQSQIDPNDLSKITSNYNQNAFGDANGDGKTNQADLTIVTSNFGMGDEAFDSSADHLLLGIPRSWLGTSNFGADNRIWVGSDHSARVTQIGTSTNRQFWPMLSPDGRKIVFSQEVPTQDWHHDLLYVMNADGTGVTKITNAPAQANNSEFDFAPSWSPDGSRIAYDCANAYYNNDLSWHLNQTNICVIDATGKNQQQLTNDWNPSYASIYPPAWLSNTQLLYGGKCGTSTLTICMYDFGTSQITEFAPTRISTASGRTNDDPVVVNNTLFYRTITGSDRRLRMADLTLGATPPISALNTTAYPAHVDVTSNGSIPLTTDVDYYTVSMNGLRFIAYYDGGDYSCPGGFFTHLYYNPQLNHQPTDPPTWTHNLGGNGNRYVEDQYCSPSWDSNPTHATDLWAMRNTVNWNP